MHGGRGSHPSFRRRGRPRNGRSPSLIVSGREAAPKGGGRGALAHHHRGLRRAICHSAPVCCPPRDASLRPQSRRGEGAALWLCPVPSWRVQSAVLVVRSNHTGGSGPDEGPAESRHTHSRLGARPARGRLECLPSRGQSRTGRRRADMVLLTRASSAALARSQYAPRGRHPLSVDPVFGRLDRPLAPSLQPLPRFPESHRP